MTNERIIFFDGVCNLCNQFVDFVIRRDSLAQFKFAPLQGSTAERLLPADVRKNLQSVVLWDQGAMFFEADAALKILSSLGLGWSIAARIGRFMPHFLRTGTYKLVAANRYRLFGRRDTCRVPTPEERTRFLD